jgi:hypothetical protein
MVKMTHLKLAEVHQNKTHIILKQLMVDIEAVIINGTKKYKQIDLL